MTCHFKLLNCFINYAFVVTSALYLHKQFDYLFSLLVRRLNGVELFPETTITIILLTYFIFTKGNMYIGKTQPYK